MIAMIKQGAGKRAVGRLMLMVRALGCDPGFPTIGVEQATLEGSRVVVEVSLPDECRKMNSAD